MLNFIAFLDEETELEEKGLSLTGRRKLARTAKRRKAQLKLARKRARRRLAKKEVLKRRARKGVRAQLAKKLLRGQDKSNVSVARKKDIENRLSSKRFQTRIAYMTKRMIPKKRRDELQRKKQG
jgi:hypothetical protein